MTGFINILEKNTKSIKAVLSEIEQSLNYKNLKNNKKHIPYQSMGKLLGLLSIFHHIETGTKLNAHYIGLSKIPGTIESIPNELLDEIIINVENNQEKLGKAYNRLRNKNSYSKTNISRLKEINTLLNFLVEKQNFNLPKLLKNQNGKVLFNVNYEKLHLLLNEFIFKLNSYDIKNTNWEVDTMNELSVNNKKDITLDYEKIHFVSNEVLMDVIIEQIPEEFEIFNDAINREEFYETFASHNFIKGDPIVIPLEYYDNKNNSLEKILLIAVKQPSIDGFNKLTLAIIELIDSEFSIQFEDIQTKTFAFFIQKFFVKKNIDYINDASLNKLIKLMNH